jgi:hypothetical protein
LPVALTVVGDVVVDDKVILPPEVQVNEPLTQLVAENDAGEPEQIGVEPLITGVAYGVVNDTAELLADSPAEFTARTVRLYNVPEANVRDVLVFVDVLTSLKSVLLLYTL